jgi:hypothetical protein
MFSSIKLSRLNTCAQIYCNDLQWTAIYPMNNKGEAHLTLSQFLSTHGAPDFVITDGAKQLIKGKFRRKAREAGVHCKEVEPYSPWSNLAESGIRELKRATRRAMLKRPSPKDLWGYCLELQALIRSNTAHDLFQLESEVPSTWMGNSKYVQPLTPQLRRPEVLLSPKWILQMKTPLILSLMRMPTQ